MGYTTNNIANIEENKIITLSANPNYVRFKTRNNTVVPVNINLTVRTTYAGTGEYPEQTKIEITETKTGIKHIFIGTNNSDNVNSNTFLLNTNRAVTAENIRTTLLKDSWIKNNFEITIPFMIDGTNINNGYIIYIKSKGGGLKYSFSFTSINSNFITVSGNPTSTSNNDTIDGGTGDVEIELDMYEDTGVFLGVYDFPNNSDFGKYITTLAKYYYKDEIWFETNSLLNKKISYSTDFLFSDGWVDAGTSLNYRYVAKTYNGIERIPFYISNVIYIINGYDYTLNDNDLSEYVYDSLYPSTLIKPLTNAPVKSYVNGQTEYFNFIFSDLQHIITITNEYNIGLTYKYFTNSGEHIRTVTKQNQNRKLFNVINTIKLHPDIESIEDATNKTVGYFTVSLNKGGVEISYEQKYEVLPECYNTITEFAFLNRLGGWDSFNFNGKWNNEFKIDDNDTIYKTLLPDFKTSDELQSVYKKTVEEVFTVQSSAISYETVEWLRELAASKAVYELSSKKYVIVTDLKLKYNSSDKSYQVEMKYIYSDTYNTNIKS